jgi:hypothetical protein
MAIFSGVIWLAGTFLVPETYPPVLLRKRAERLSKMTGKVYKSRMQIEQGNVTVKEAFTTALSRPWILLFKEPIVLLLSIYMAIVYGTLYLCFASFPIVYREHRGWSEGISGLAFLGVTVGMIAAIIYTVPDNKRYMKAVSAAMARGELPPPEARLPPAMVGSLALPIGLFWFAWTNSPKVHWIASVAAGAPFGFGMVLVFLSITNYLIDSYTIFAASVLAANSVLRSLFGAAFPLFTTQMFDNLGIHWASSIPAFLALLCVPLPFLFYRYGPAIRERCAFAKEAEEFMKRVRERQAAQEKNIAVTTPGDSTTESERAAVDADEVQVLNQDLEEVNPYVIDRINTRESRINKTMSRTSRASKTFTRKSTSHR